MKGCTQLTFPFFSLVFGLVLIFNEKIEMFFI